MRAHLAELDGCDDTEHHASFYSQAITVEGIRELCSLAGPDPDLADHVGDCVGEGAAPLDGLDALQIL